MELPDPYRFVRIVTLILATAWTIRGALNMRAFFLRWAERLDRWGVERSWLWRSIALFVARVTVLDPINLALILALVGLWTLRPSL